MARECIEKLLQIDRIVPDKLESINSIIYTFLEGMRLQKKQVPKPGSINILKNGSDVKAAVKYHKMWISPERG